jgi:uncharacterized membrane protein
MSEISESIEVAAPVREVYDQWTQFEDFPEFMGGVKRVTQLDDRTLEWEAEIAGRDKRWRAEIVQQEPDEIIAWRSTSGARNDGTVTFDRLADDRTRISLRLDVDPEGPIENLGDALGFVSRQVIEDLGRFKTFIESRGQATGAWRGTIGATADRGSRSSD